MIHQCHDSSTYFDLKGLHFKEKDRSEKVKVIKNDNFSYSTSFHKIEESIENSFFDYCFLSPIFDSISKQNYQSYLEKKIVKKELKNRQSKIFALGGVTYEKIDEVLEMGFDGIGILGSFWNLATTKERISYLEKICKKINL